MLRVARVAKTGSRPVRPLFAHRMGFPRTRRYGIEYEYHFLAVFRAIAVGTAISGRPPHRSVRAELLHTAPTFDVDVRSVLQDTDGGYVGWGAIDCRS